MAILNLLILICSFAITITSFAIFYYFRKHSQIPLVEQRRRTGSLLQRLSCIVITFTILINYIFFEPFDKPIAITNQYTLFFLFLLAIQVFGIMVRRQFDLKMK